MTEPFDPRNQMSKDLGTSGGNFKYLPGGESSPEIVVYQENDLPFVFSGTTPSITVSEDAPEINIFDDKELEEKEYADSDYGDFRLPKDFTITFSPVSNGKYGELVTDSSGTTTASIEVECSAVNEVNTFEIRVVKVV